MDSYKNMAERAIDALKQKGADDAACFIRKDGITEASVEAGDFSLLRSYNTALVEVSAVKNGLQVTTGAKRIDCETIDTAVEKCWEELSQLAGANDEFTMKNSADILPSDPSQNVSAVVGELECDTSGMLSRMREVIDESENSDDEEMALNHMRRQSLYLNSRGVAHESDQGHYYMGRGVPVMPDMKQSFKGLGKYDFPFDKKLLEGPVTPIGDKFEGTIIFAPPFTRHMWYLAMFVLFGEFAMSPMFGNPMPWINKIGEKVAGDKFTLRNMPHDPRFCGAPIFSKEGYVLNDVTFIENGVLKALPMGARTAKQLNMQPTMCPVDYESEEIVPCNIVIPGGDTSIKDMIRNVDRGLIAFGMPGFLPHNPADGAFASVVRGAALIEHGEVTSHVSELTVSHDFYEMLKNVSAVSSETRFTGGDSTPWIAFDGFTIQ